MSIAAKHIAILSITTSLLVGCGGGGGGGGSALAPEPTSGPTRIAEPSSFETTEYNQNYGLGNIGASEAYAFSGTGQGVKVAVIDSGIDTDHPDLFANIDPASKDINAGRNDVQDDIGHGTAVAGVVGAMKNNSGVHGVAYQSSILAIRADEDATAPGACIPECGFFLSDLLAAIDYAIAQNVKVINLSLGASATFSNAYLNKLNEAGNAGIVVVAAAGNESGIQPEFPAAYATHEDSVGNIVSVGAVDQSENLAIFSNQAGTVQDRHLVAPGVSIVTTANGGGFASASGTSFSTPHVAGAAAILFQLFPNLTPQQVVDILLDTARDLGLPGTDTTYGRGHLDIGAAVQPQGTMSVPSSSTAEGEESGAPLSETAFSASPAFAAALHNSDAGLLAIDKYNRGYLVELGYLSQFRMTPGSQVVFPLTSGEQKHVSGNVLLPEDTQFGLREVSVSATDHYRNSNTLAAYQSDRSIAADPEHSNVTSFRFANDNFDHLTFTGGDNVAPRQMTGDLPKGFAPLVNATSIDEMSASNGWGLVSKGRGMAMGFQSNSVDTPFLKGKAAFAGQVSALRSNDGSSELVQGSFGPRWVRDDLSINLTGHFGQLGESDQVMGLRGSGALALNGASSGRIAGVSASVDLGDGLTFYGRFDRMTVDFASTGSAQSDEISASSMTFGLAGRDLFAGGDRWAIRVSQPLRINKGSMGFHLPQSVDANNNVHYDRVQLSLKPDSREWNIEAGWQSGVWLPGGKTGRIGFNALYVKDPGHIGTADDKWGGMMRLTLPF